MFSEPTNGDYFSADIAFNFHFVLGVVAFLALVSPSVLVARIANKFIERLFAIAIDTGFAGHSD